MNIQDVVNGGLAHNLVDGKLPTVNTNIVFDPESIKGLCIGLVLVFIAALVAQRLLAK